MAESNVNIMLDTVRKNRISVIYAVENDYGARFITVTVTSDGKKKAIEKSAVVTINAERSDGQRKAFEGSVNEDGTVMVPVTQWMLEREGEVLCSVSAVTETARLTTTHFYLEVQHSVWDGTNGPSVDDPNYDVVVSIIASENVRISNENERIRAENSRKTAESARDNAEIVRIANEGVRIDNEAERVSAESVRKTEFATWQGEIGKISVFDKRIENLEEAVSEVEIVIPSKDASTAYAKDVPTGALSNAMISEIGGMSYDDNGVLRNAAVTAVEGVGANRFSGEVSFKTAPTTYSFANGTLKLKRNGGAIQGGVWSKEKYKSGTYTISFNLSGMSNTNFVLATTAIASATNTGTWIKTWFANGQATYTLTLTEDRYIGFFTDGTVEITASNIMLNQGSNALTYIPYFKNIFEIPEAVQALDGYGEGIPGGKYNLLSLEDKKHYKNVKRVILKGTESVSYANHSAGSDTQQFNVTIADCGSGLVLCDRLPSSWDAAGGLLGVASVSTQLVLGVPKSWLTPFGFVDGTASTYVSSFLAYLKNESNNGTPLTVIYPLAAVYVVETDLSDYFGDDNFIGVEAGGTVTMVNEYGYDVPSVVEYTIVTDKLIAPPGDGTDDVILPIFKNEGNSLYVSYDNGETWEFLIELKTQEDAVLYTPQNLADEEKAQARENIGAVDEAFVEDAIKDVTEKMSAQESLSALTAGTDNAKINFPSSSGFYVFTFGNDTLVPINNSKKVVSLKTNAQRVVTNAVESTATKIYYSIETDSLRVVRYDNVLDGNKFILLATVRRGYDFGGVKYDYCVSCSLPVDIYIDGVFQGNTSNGTVSVGYIDYDLTVKSINHRGYNTIAPENTIPAFILSKKQGFYYVECDVSFTADGVCVLLHDSTIDRTSNGSGAISSMTYSEVRQYDFGSWKSEEYANTKIPTLREFLIACKGLGLHPYIEIKNDSGTTQERVESIVNEVKLTGMKGKVSYISFSDAYLGYIKNIDPNARLVYVTHDITNSIITTATNLKTDTNEVAIDCLHSAVTTDKVNLCANADIPLEVWTANSEAGILSLNPYITGVTSDNLIAGKVLCDKAMVYKAYKNKDVSWDDGDGIYIPGSEIEAGVGLTSVTNTNTHTINNRTSYTKFDIPISNEYDYTFNFVSSSTETRIGAQFYNQAGKDRADSGVLIGVENTYDTGWQSNGVVILGSSLPKTVAGVRITFDSGTDVIDEITISRTAR